MSRRALVSVEALKEPGLTTCGSWLALIPDVRSMGSTFLRLHWPARWAAGKRLRDGGFHLVVVRVDQAQQLEEIRLFDSRLLRSSLNFVAQILVHQPIRTVH